jgi:hypothetical protein
MFAMTGPVRRWPWRRCGSFSWPASAERMSASFVLKAPPASMERTERSVAAEKVSDGGGTAQTVMEAKLAEMACGEGSIVRG